MNEKGYEEINAHSDNRLKNAIDKLREVCVSKSIVFIPGVKIKGVNIAYIKERNLLITAKDIKAEEITEFIKREFYCM